MLDATSTPSRRVAQARAKRPPLSPTHGRMLRRLNQLRSLARGREQHDEPLGDLAKWAMLVAECMLYHSKGCDYFSFRDALRPVPALNDLLDEKTVMEAIHAVTRTFKRRGAAYRTIRNKTAGKWLALRAEECKRYGISTLHAVDGPTETAEERLARRQREDRDRKRERRRTASKAAKRAERKRGQRRRVAKGARPHAESRCRKQPWLLDGIGRSTWYARQRTKTSTPQTWTKTSVLPILLLMS